MIRRRAEAASRSVLFVAIWAPVGVPALAWPAIAAFGGPPPEGCFELCADVAFHFPTYAFAVVLLISLTSTAIVATASQEVIVAFGRPRLIIGAAGLVIATGAVWLLGIATESRPAAIAGACGVASAAVFFLVATMSTRGRPSRPTA